MARVLHHAKPGVKYSEHDFDRYFRRVYQHFASPGGYMLLDDAKNLLDSLSSSDEVLMGITSNTPTRHMETVLPMLDIHNHFKWFSCSQDVGYEKPSLQIYEASFEQARFFHIGDSYAADYCGAKRFGFQALLDWLEAPDYEGKTAEDVQENTITSLDVVASMLRAPKTIESV